MSHHRAERAPARPGNPPQGRSCTPGGDVDKARSCVAERPLNRANLRALQSLVGNRGVTGLLQPQDVLGPVQREGSGGVGTTTTPAAVSSGRSIGLALGEGWFELWQELARDTADERRRAEINEQRFAKFSMPAPVRLSWDLRRLEHISRHYHQLMERIVEGQAVDPSDVHQLYAIYSLAIEVVRADNEILDATFAFTVTVAFVTGPVMTLQWCAANLLRVLKVLTVRLEQAKEERTEAWVQAALNVAITGATLLMPHLGLLAKVGIATGQYVLDNALGPEKSVAADIGGDATAAAGLLADAIARIEGLGSRKVKIAEAGSDAVTVVGFAFDVNEVLVGHENYAEIERLMNQATKSAARISAVIRRNRPALIRFSLVYQRQQIVVEDLMEERGAVRRLLLEEISSAGYSPR